MKCTKFCSLRLPFGRYVHYAGVRKLGESRPAYAKGLVHYDPRGNLTGRMIRSFFGEPNHYDPQGACTGYSRRGGLGVLVHYDAKANTIGRSYCVFGLLWIHHIRKKPSLG